MENKVIKRKDTVQYKNSSNCIAYEYPSDDKNMNVALVEIDGRYPDTGYVMNEKVKELVYVEEGEGKVIIEEEEYELKDKDVVIIQPKQKYFFYGKFKLLVFCTPPWYQGQHKNIN